MQQRNKFLSLAIALLTTAITLAAAANQAQAIGWDSDDFILGDIPTATLRVYDSDFTFKGILDDGRGEFPAFYPSGLDFDAAGNLVAVETRQSDTGIGRVRVYNPGGDVVTDLTNDSVGQGPPFGDLAVGPTNARGGRRYYVASNTNGQNSGLIESAPSGQISQYLDSGTYFGVAVLPNHVVWGGSPDLDGIPVFYPRFGSKLQFLIPFDNGQQRAATMSYSHLTDTVLILDRVSEAIYERETDGTFVRSFAIPDSFQNQIIAGLSRGPENNVFANAFGTILRWQSDGTFIDSIRVIDNNSFSTGLVWAGNVPPQVPEPSTAVLLAIAGLPLITRRRRTAT